MNLGKSFHLLAAQFHGINNDSSVANAMGGLQKRRILYCSLSQDSKIIYNSDVIIFFMSQFELGLQCPSGSLENFCTHAVVHV